MTGDGMEPGRLKAIIAAYGAKPEHWPEAERRAALAALERSPGLGAELAGEEPLDRLLDRVAAPIPTPALRGAILARAPVRRRPSALAGLVAAWRDFAGELGMRAVGPVLAASLALGILAAGLISGEAATSGPDLLQLAQLDDGMVDY